MRCLRAGRSFEAHLGDEPRGFLSLFHIAAGQVYGGTCTCELQGGLPAARIMNGRSERSREMCKISPSCPARGWCVYLPSPVFAPVTSATLPLREGTLPIAPTYSHVCTGNFEAGGDLPAWEAGLEEFVTGPRVFSTGRLFFAGVWAS